MCQECGCGSGGGDVKIGAHTHEHEHHHGHEHGHEHSHEHHDHGHAHGKQTLNLNRSLMEKNALLAERNREFFRAKKLLVLNVVSSPGSGKTTFIRETSARRRAFAHCWNSGGANHHRHGVSSGCGHGFQSGGAT